jgi:hypothetical protein
MNWSIWLAAALCFGAPLSASAQQGRDRATPSKDATSTKNGTAQSGEKVEPKRTLKRGKKEAEPEGPSRSARLLARRTRSVFVYAVESCQRAGSRCDPSLSDDAEKRFMDACGACATMEQCQAERDSIRSGAAKLSSDLCGK